MNRSEDDAAEIFTLLEDRLQMERTFNEGTALGNFVQWLRGDGTHEIEGVLQRLYDAAAADGMAEGVAYEKQRREEEQAKEMKDADAKKAVQEC